MSKIARMMQQATAGAGGAGLDVDDVFSVDVRSGTGHGTAWSVNNGIDLSGEGGLVFYKSRTQSQNWIAFDTVRGKPSGYSGLALLYPNATNAQSNWSWITQFNNNGFSGDGQGNKNDSNHDYVSWTFRKAKKFFDIVTYTGTSGTQAISHNLGSVPGMIIVKCTSGTGNWRVYHRGINSSVGYSNPEEYVLILNGTNEANYSDSYWNDTAPTSTHFTVGGDDDVNDFGDTYVAYLFAHNNNDGEFGPNQDQDIIKCGSYNGNSTIGHTINLGFEAQWVLVRSTSNLRKWMLYDVMRGMPVDGNGAALYPNDTDDEESLARIGASNVGFQLTSTDSFVNVSGETYIYMAIRRGSLAAPTDATKVFAMSTRGATTPPPAWVSGFPVDFALETVVNNTGGFLAASRLTSGNYLDTSSTNAEQAYSDYDFDYNNGWSSMTGVNSNNQSWMWKRAPGYFDCVAFSGTGSARTVSHNLSAVPEMLWIKRRSNTQNWAVYHKGANGGTDPEDYGLELNSTSAEFNTNLYFNDTAPTSTVFTVGTQAAVNTSGETYIAYLFATVAGVSKVGSFTHTSGSTNVDCGFTNGARFVLIKRTNTTGSWLLFDTARGINASANDPVLYLDSTAAQDSGYDLLEPLSSGFTVSGNDWGAGGDFIFYAIA